LKTLTEGFAGQPFSVISAAKEVAATRGWKVASETGSELEVRTKISGRSWGESVKVRVDSNQLNPGVLMVTVSSSARFQVYDWGKSTDNVALMMDGLRQRLQGAQPSMVQPQTQAAVQSQTFKFCANCGNKIPIAMQFCTRSGQRAD